MSIEPLHIIPSPEIRTSTLTIDAVAQQVGLPPSHVLSLLEDLMADAYLLEARDNERNPALYLSYLGEGFVLVNDHLLPLLS